MLTPEADTVTTPGSSAGATRQLLWIRTALGRVRRPVGADLVSHGVTEIVQLVAGGGDHDDATLLAYFAASFISWYMARWPASLLQ